MIIQHQKFNKVQHHSSMPDLFKTRSPTLLFLIRFGFDSFGCFLWPSGKNVVAPATHAVTATRSLPRWSLPHDHCFRCCSCMRSTVSKALFKERMLSLTSATCASSDCNCAWSCNPFKCLMSMLNQSLRNCVVVWSLIALSVPSMAFWCCPPPSPTTK